MTRTELRDADPESDASASSSSSSIPITSNSFATAASDCRILQTRCYITRAGVTEPEPEDGDINIGDHSAMVPLMIMKIRSPARGSVIHRLATRYLHGEKVCPH